MTCGIYLILNKRTGQMYFGKSINIEKRWLSHISLSRNIQHIDKAINKYGVSNFLLLIICECNEDIINEMEQYYIWEYNTYLDDFHYNHSFGGDFSPMKDPRIAKKQGQKMIGKNNPMYGKTGILNPTYGRKHTKEEIEKISGSNNGQYGKLSPNNTTGVRYLSLCISNQYKQGYYFEYSIRYYGKIIYKTKSVNLQKIKNKILSDGYKWIIKDKEKYKKFLEKYDK